MKLKRNLKNSNELIVDIAPLVDVVFLLLIFFMLSSTFILQPGFKINLPESTTSDLKNTDKIKCYITKQGLIYINDKKVDLNMLLDELSERLKYVSEKTVSIHGDYGIKFGLAIKITDIAKLAGAEAVVYATRPPENN